MEDLFHAVAPFGSMDANALLERCNEYGIHPADVVEYAQDNFEYSPKADDLAYNINVLFEALFYIRISKLCDICREATENIDEVIYDNNNGCNGHLSNFNLGLQARLGKDVLLYKEHLSKLQKFLDSEAMEYVHINAMCSCFDNEVLSDLDGVLSSEALLEWLEEKGDFDVNN